MKAILPMCQHLCWGMARYEGNMCCARSPEDLYTCTLEIGHPGPHVACGGEEPKDHAYEV
jgi:hypothetical protein